MGQGVDEGSADRGGIFAGDDPIALARAWLAEAGRTEPNDPNAAALATVDEAGCPNVRIVLIKGIEDGPRGGFVLYTNHESDKGRELDGARQAAFVIHWKSLRRQIRVRGAVTRVEPEISDAYYATRGLGSRLGAWASAQSRPLASRADLEAALRAAREAQGEAPARPPFWGGYRITPRTIEFWADGIDRLHDRFRWSRAAPGERWSVMRLNP